jgi:hypothetical protein
MTMRTKTRSRHWRQIKNLRERLTILRKDFPAEPEEVQRGMSREEGRIRSRIKYLGKK